VKMMTRVTMAQIVDRATTRKVSERTQEPGLRMPSRKADTRGFALRLRFTHAVAHSAHGFDHVDTNLLAQAPDKDLDSIGIPVEILIIEMFDQFGAGNDLAHMVHQIGKQAKLVGRELERHSVHIGPGYPCVESQGPAYQLR